MPAGAEESATEADRQRLDKWLWHARMVRTRTAAAALVSAGHVRLNGARVTSAGKTVKVGDVLTVMLDGGVKVLEVKGFSPRRGDSGAARMLYRDVPPS